jgi:hypothetical protein
MGVKTKTCRKVFTTKSTQNNLNFFIEFLITFLGASEEPTNHPKANQFVFEGPLRQVLGTADWGLSLRSGYLDIRKDFLPLSPRTSISYLLLPLWSL